MEPIPSQRTYNRPLHRLVPFFTLHAFSFVSLLVLLVTFATGRVKRDPTITNLIAVFMTFSASTALMFISGNLTSGSDKIFGLCLVNGATVVGGTPSLSAAAFAVVLQVFFRIMAAKGRLVLVAGSKRTTTVLVLLPWSLWLAFVVGSLIVGLLDRSKVYRAVYYCGIDSNGLTLATAIAAAIILITNLIFEVVVGVILARHFLSIRRVRRASIPPAQNEEEMDSMGSAMVLGVNVGLVIRLGLFGICVFAALICAFATLSDFTSIVADVAVATISVLAFVIFSSQTDVLRCWHILPPSSRTRLHSQFDEASFRRPGILNQDYPLEYRPRDPDVESTGEERTEEPNRFISPDWGGGEMSGKSSE